MIVPVPARRGNQGGDPVKPLQWGEMEQGLTIGPGFREMIEKVLALRHPFQALTGINTALFVPQAVAALKQLGPNDRYFSKRLLVLPFV